MSTNIGYKKNTVDYIPELGTETGYLNKSQATELIKQYTQDIEFYEIEPAEVVACHLNPNREDFPKINGKPDLSKMGCIEVSLLHSQSSGEVFDSFIKPLSRAIVQFPVAGEIVNVAQYDDDFYYYNPLCFRNKINLNKMPGRKKELDVSESGLFFNRPVVASEGDTLIQSRFGSTIHFGSDKDAKMPFVRISCGQNKNKETVVNKKNIYYPHTSNINADGASIWMTTNQHVGLDTAAPSKMKQKTLGGNYQTAIVSNADTQAINARAGDVSAFAQRNINLAAYTSINLESEFGEIKLGDVDTNNPVVLGDQLRDFLDLFIKNIQEFSEARKQATAKVDQDKAYDKLFSDLKTLREDLGEETGASFHSNKVFIRENHNPPDVTQELDNQVSRESGEDDDFPFDLDSMWEQTVWNEIQDVKEVNYEVERITATAGVRG